jgi:vacuolar-type H+-ATPase subunit I/STV1
MRGKNDDVTNPPKELLEQIMMARVTQEVGLNDEQTVLLLRRFNATRERMAQLRKERAAAIKELRELVNKDKENTEVEAKLQALMNIDERLASTRREAYDQVSAGLTPWQRAKLYIFTSEFESELRAVVQRARERLQQGRNGAGPAAENGDAAPLPGEGRRLGRMLRGERPGAPPAPNEAR